MNAEEIIEETLRALKIAIQDSGKTQLEVATEVGIEYSTISRYLNGRRDLPYPVFVRIAEAANVEPLSILAEVDRRVRARS